MTSKLGLHIKRTFSLRDFLLQGGLLFGALVLMMIVFGFISPYFLTVSNIVSILLQVSIIGFLALGQTLVIITAGIDLSVGSLVSIASVTTALTQIYGIFVSSSLAVFVCMALGAVSGLLIAKGKVPPFITTLGMMGIAKGLALVMSNGTIISGTTSAFRSIASSTFIGIPVPAIIFILIAVLVWIYLKKTKWGYELYAVGGNPEAAKLSGINVDRVLLTVYVLSGLLAAIGGIIYTSRLTVGQSSAGDGMEMYAIAAVVIGGASLNGGRGGVFGTVIGVFILGVLSNFLNLTGISPYAHEGIRGLIILFAVYYTAREYTKVRIKKDKFGCEPSKK